MHDAWLSQNGTDDNRWRHGKMQKIYSYSVEGMS